MPPSCRRAFAQAVNRPDAAINMAEAALLIAKEEYPALDVPCYLARLDAMATELRQRLSREMGIHQQIGTLSDYLFNEQEFRGNKEDYYDPRNSFFNEVLDRRIGIPITLSMLYIEMGQRVDLRLRGVGMPGHFLVKHVGPEEEIVIDPFNAGAVVSAADCRRILERVSHGKMVFQQRFLAAVGTRQILARMLTNLKVIYFNHQAYAKALSVVDRLLILDPKAAAEFRDRGLLSSQLKRYPQAMADLERYLQLAPGAEDVEVIREHLRALRQRMASMN